MTTFLDLQTKVKTRLIDTPSAVQAEVPSLVNGAIKTIQTMRNFKAMEYSLTVITVPSTRTLAAVPSDFKQWRLRPYGLTNTGDQYDVQWAPDSVWVAALYTTLDTGEPRVILDADPTDGLATRNIQVWPLPDTGSDFVDGNYRIIIPYIRFLPDLSADGDTNWFTNNATDYIIRKATAEGFALDWDETRVAFWEARAEEKKKEVYRRDMLFRLGGVNTLVPHYQGVNDLTLRR